MSDPAPSSSARPLQPLPYHRETVAYLSEAESALWNWSASADAMEEYAVEVRTNLLKANYRLDAEGHPDLVTRCAAVAGQLGISAPVTLYQASGGLESNASLCHLPGEAHLIFTGPILTLLKGRELEAVLGHELAHCLLWEIDEGAFLIADRLLMGAAGDGRALSAHVQTARRYRLYTEIFADRGALAACGDLEAAVAALVKTETGLPEVSAASYLRQADEIFAQGPTATKGLNHPETFIRARALRLWHEGDENVDQWVKAVIEGPMALDELDLGGQRRMLKQTRRFLAELLRPGWFQTAKTLAHARAFFPDFTPGRSPDPEAAEALNGGDASHQEYLCYLLLDFAAVDAELEEVPLAAALVWSERIGLAERFEKLVMKELGLGKRPLNKLKKEAAAILAQAEQQPAES